MRKLILALALLLAPTGAWAQCTGVFPPNTLCGNLGATPAPPAAFTATTSIFGPTTTTSPDIPYWKTNTGTQLGDSGVPLFSVTVYGADPTGVADSSTALNNALSAAAVAGGGTVIFPAGIYKITQQITIPHDSTTPQFNQHQIRITGQAGGNNWYGVTGAPTSVGASVLNMTYSGTADCKLCSLGRGSLLIDHLTFEDTGADSTPFFLSTNTTTTIRDNVFNGTGNATQQAIVLGGTSTSVGNTTNSAFQGYGTTVTYNTFLHLEGILLQTFANGIVIANNQWINTAGGNAAITSNGNVALPNSGLYISGNVIEMVDFVYGIVFTLTQNSTVSGNSFYDFGGSALFPYNFSNSSTWNTIVRGLDVTSNAPLITGDQTSLVATTIIGESPMKDTSGSGLVGSELAGNVVIKGTYNATKAYAGQLTLRDTANVSGSYLTFTLNPNTGNAEIRANNQGFNARIFALPEGCGGSTSGFAIGKSSGLQQCLDVGGAVATSQYYLNSSGKPTASSCGTSPTVATGSSNQNGQFTTGNSINSCTLTFANSYPTNAWCVAQPASAGVTSAAVTFSSNAQFSVSWAPSTSGAVFNYNCGGN